MRRRTSIVPILFSLFAAVAADAQVVTEFPIPTAASGPLRITTGPDGNLWFTEHDVHKIGRITPAGVVTEFPVPNPPNFPNGITAGPDGNVWFTVSAIPSKVGRITPAGTITMFTTPTAGGQLSGITAGPDGNLWYCAGGALKIGRITTAGAATEFPGGSGVSIAAGPDGALWFTEQSANSIGRITTAGAMTHFPVPTSNALLVDIVAGADGDLWFTESGALADQIGRITTAGDIMEFLTPSLANVSFIAAGPDGNVWFTEPHNTHDRVGRATPAGILTEYPTLSGSGQSAGITAGPDGALWFTQPNTNKIGRITVPGAAAKFNTLAPCRIADTRLPDGPWGGPALDGGSIRSFVIGGQCGVPATATAVSFNFTVTAPTGLGDIRVYPGQTAVPTSTTLNWFAGRTRANNAVIGLGSFHDISVAVDQPGGTVHFIIDVNGYFQ